MENTNFDKNTRAKKHEILFFLMAASFGILAMLPAYFWGTPTGADFDNHFRFALPFYDEIGKGNWFPAWLGESNYGFGDPRFRFYPPLLYYTLGAFRFVTGDWYTAFLLAMTAFSMLGAVGIYLWTRQNLSARTAVLSAAIFAFAPYHLTQFYQASLLAEFAAISFIPFAFMFVERLLNSQFSPKKLSNIAGLGIFFALIVTTHIPTTVVASLSLGLFSLLLTDWKNYKKGLIFCACGIFLGLILSSWFWVKMVSELGFIQAGINVSSEYYDYRNNFVFSPFALNNLNTFFASLITALTVGIFLPFFLISGQILRRKSDDAISKFFTSEKSHAAKVLFAVTILAILTLLMTTDLSRPVWWIVPKLKDIQFPFRWLTIVSILICPLTALAFQVWQERLKQKKLRSVQLVLLLGFFAALFFTVKDLVIDSDYISREQFIQRVETRRGARSFNDWLPRGAKEVKDLMPLEGNADAGKRAIIISDWQAQKRNLTIAAGEETQIRLKTYHYPHWQAFQIKNGQSIPLTTSKAEDGTLLISIPNEAAEIEVVFVETALVKTALIISALGWLTALGLIITRFRRG